MNYKNYAKKEIKNGASLETVFMNLGGTISEISSSNALKNSDIVYSCINLIASTIARMPITLYREVDIGKEKINNEVSYLLKLRPNEFTSAVDFKQALIANMLLYGNGYAYVETKKGIPCNLILLDSSLTCLEKINGKIYVITTIDNKPYKIKYEQVIHIKDLNIDGINGISRITAIRNKLNNRVQSDNLIGNMYKNGGNGSIKGVLNVPSDLSSEAKKKLKQGFTNVLNSDGTGIAVLDSGITLQPINKMSLADQEFIDNLKLTKEDISMIYNLNPVLLGSSENTSYNNMESINQNFVQGLIPIVEKLEQEFTYKLLTSTQRLNHYFKLNVSSALRANDEARASFYSKMIEKGLMTINEVREKEDLNSVVGGDIIRVDLNHVSLEQVNNYQLSKAGATDNKKGGENNE